MFNITNELRVHICLFFSIFFSSSDGKTKELKSRLMKIAGSGEDGVGQEHCLNRTAKLVLAASGSVNKLSVPPKLESPEGKSKLYSMHTAQQTSPQVCVLQRNPQTTLVLNMTPFSFVS